LADVFPTAICPRCHTLLKETEFSRQGTIVTFTVIRYPPKGFEKESPYVVALVDIENGPRVIGRIKANPNYVQIGKAVSSVRDNHGALEFALQL
jgi:uncharacterized OB-fold protein